jgi:hypothetical protein
VSPYIVRDEKNVLLVCAGLMQRDVVWRRKRKGWQGVVQPLVLAANVAEISLSQKNASVVRSVLFGFVGVISRSGTVVPSWVRRLRIHRELKEFLRDVTSYGRVEDLLMT